MSFKAFIEDIFESTYCSFCMQEYLFGPNKLVSNTFGIKSNFSLYPPNMRELTDTEKKHAMKVFTEMNIYSYLEEIYEYAVEGVLGKNHWIDLIEEVNIYFQHVESDFSKISDEAKLILGMAHLRFGIDGERDLICFNYSSHPNQVIAKMAGLDERTVRNAASEGMFTQDGISYHAEAIKIWLNNKKGFKRTKVDENQTGLQLVDIKTAQQFSQLISTQKANLGKLLDEKKFKASHYSFDKHTLLNLESGIFDLPLNTVSALANAFHFDEKALLHCIMRVFFAHELSLIKE